MVDASALLGASRRTKLRLAAGVLLAALLVGVAGQAVGHEPPELRQGTVTDPAEGRTVISVQGYNIDGNRNPEKPARLVAASPDGGVAWTESPLQYGVDFLYDVDPLPNGDLLLVGTRDRNTTVLRLDGETREAKWAETFDDWDTHDVTLTAEGNLLIANMRNTRDGVSHDRVYVYNRTSDRVEWEWQFRDHYPADTDDGISAGDWTHVNDVDVIAPGLYMLSPRNFDQVIVVNRTTGDIVLRLGEDGAHEILDEQHNPQYLQTEAGAPAFVVADSENDRVVEYTCDQAAPDHPVDGDMEPNCDWERTWTVGTEQLSWPRDADRLPNGNTLITDTLNHRVVEVTPQGEVVWEFYAPWIPFDAERPVNGREAGGPTMQDLDVSGRYALNGSSEVNQRRGPLAPERIGRAASALPGGGVIEWATETYSGVVPWLRPSWLAPDAFGLLAVAVLFGACWALVEGLAAGRRHLRRSDLTVGRRGD